MKPELEGRGIGRALLRQVTAELREQADWLLGGSQLLPDAAVERTDERLASLEERLARLEEGRLPEIAASLAALREEIRPIQSALQIALPVRRTIARLRGRG